MGPTASGKSLLAESLADHFSAELINADAFQVYRGLDIGTAKPGDKSRYHLLDFKAPNEGYGVGEFCQRSQELLETFWELRRNVVVVGGTGLYIRALFEQYTGLQPFPDPSLREALNTQLCNEGLPSLQERLLKLDPLAQERVDINNPIRVTRAIERLLDPRPPVTVSLPAFRRLKLGLEPDPIRNQARIASRVLDMVHNGWVEEVQALLDSGFGPADPAFRAIGYSELAAYVLGRTELEEATAATIAETRRYAKRQRTWLRSEPGLAYLPGMTNTESTVAQHLSEAIAAIQSHLQ